MTVQIKPAVYVSVDSEAIFNLMETYHRKGMIFAVKEFRMIAAPTIVFGLKEAKTAIDYLRAIEDTIDYTENKVRVMIRKPLMMNEYYQSERIEIYE